MARTTQDGVGQCLRFRQAPQRAAGPRRNPAGAAASGHGKVSHAIIPFLLFNCSRPFEAYRSFRDLAMLASALRRSCLIKSSPFAPTAPFHAQRAVAARGMSSEEKAAQAAAA
jgi:hypothetical protein